jgi:hypothetical protein
VRVSSKKSGNPSLEETYSLHFVAAWKAKEKKAEAPTSPENPFPILDSPQSQDDDIPF